MALLAMLTAAACKLITAPEGIPCGRNQHASAKAILPDTGINAGREIDVSFLQHDPVSMELSDVWIQPAWPAGAGPDTEPDPRVRLVSALGQVLVDTLSSGHDPTWFAYRSIRDAQSRNALYNAFATQALWLELWHAGAASPGTRILVTTTDYGVYGPATCL